MHNEKWEERLDDWLNTGEGNPQPLDPLKHAKAAANALEPLAATRQSSAFELSLEKRLMTYLAEYNGQQAEYPTAAPAARSGTTGARPFKLGRRASQIWRAQHLASRIAVAAALLLTLLAGATVLAIEATPGTLFYGLHQFGQNVQVGLAQSKSDRARLQINYARDALNVLEGAISTGDYSNFAADLTDFQSKYGAAVAAVSQLPDGTLHAQLESQVASVGTRATTDFSAAMPRMTWSNRLVTTSAIAKLGKKVLAIKSITFGRGRGTSGNGGSGGTPETGSGLLIHIHGFGFESGAKVYINGRPAGIVHGVAANDIQVELAGVTSVNAGTTIGVSNPDGTATQITLSERSDPTAQPMPAETPGSHGSDHSGSIASSGHA
ncbi:MAG TPA: hypothetical protein VFN11_18285 [Ktedonobacterales bacterium]|nr:hypothetical protein [Ktedonobacterales bacterium]